MNFLKSSSQYAMIETPAKRVDMEYTSKRSSTKIEDITNS